MIIGCDSHETYKKELNGENLLFNGQVYHCSGKDYGNLCGNIEAFANKARGLVPDL